MLARYFVRMRTVYSMFFKLRSTLLWYTASSLIAIFYLHTVCSRDPTSIFFDTQTAYSPGYSAIRSEQAENFIREFAGTTQHNTNTVTVPPHQRRFCVGIPSVARPDADYLRTSIGSLLEGLTKPERDDLYLIVFIPNANPAEHPDYSEEWLSDIVDEVLVYNLTDGERDSMSQMETHSEHFREKVTGDYAHLLRACYVKETTFVAVFEDDVLALDGWFHRTVAALEQIEAQSADFLYLRLFYTEQFLGWNKEYWPWYLAWSMASAGVPTVLLFCLREQNQMLRKNLSKHSLLAICGLFLPTFIVLLFAAGRVTVHPIPVGVGLMNNFGCCAQGFVFPREKAISIVQWFEEKNIGFTDSMIEEYADEHGENRWAITPSVIQHIGGKSSKGGGQGSPGSPHHMSVSETIWNFAFELHDAADLREEHSLAIGKSYRPER